MSLVGIVICHETNSPRPRSEGVKLRLPTPLGHRQSVANKLDVIVVRRRLKIAAVVACVVLGIPFAFVAFQFTGIAYDRNRVMSMCAKLVPGTTMTDVRRIVAASGVGQLLPPENGPNPLGSYDATDKNWFFAIPVAIGIWRRALRHLQRWARGYQSGDGDAMT